MTEKLLDIDKLDSLYKRYNKKEYVHPDPLEFLYDYQDLKDREIVGLIASSLAYGRVLQILKSVSEILNKIGNSPYNFLINSNYQSLCKLFTGFKHRFTTGDDLSNMLTGVKHIIIKYGSIQECFISGLDRKDETTLSGLNYFVDKINCKGKKNHLIPSPEAGSACKRLNLFLRWMVRIDDVDPGGWDNFLVPKLIIPLDVHMHKISLYLGLTSRKQANMKTALEITNGFKKILPDDPVKYDFVLTRLGIRKDMNIKIEDIK